MKKTFCFVQMYHISERGGGAEVQANFLAQELARQGHDVHYICKADSNAQRSVLMGEIKVHFIGNLSGYSAISLHLIYNHIINIKPDFIVERMSSYFAAAILKAKKQINFKYIWICTDNESALPYKTMWNYIRKLPLHKAIYILPRAFIIDVVRTRAILNAEIRFTQNNIQKKRLTRYFGVTSNQMISGHPTENIDSLSVSSKFQNRVVIWCGNLGRHKRPELFIALAKLAQKRNYKFILIGGHANKKYKESLFSFCPDNITKTGQLSYEEALTYFDSASIFVNTSWSEGFSNTYIQAWLRGVPTIVFGSDPDNIIRDKQLGFDVKSVQEALGKLDELLNDQDIYRKFSLRVENYARENHTIELMTENFTGLIENQHV